MGSSQRQLLLPILGLLILTGTALSGVQEVHNVLELTGQAVNKLRFSTDVATGKYTPPEEMDPQFWYNIADEEIAKRLLLPQPNAKKAKNVIMFLGDGMPLATVTAARILKGQRQGKTGEESSLSFEQFPYTGLSRTYCTNSQVPDSACTATAYLCGVKTNVVSIGVSAAVEFNNCTASQDPANRLTSIAEWSQKKGKSTGFVTTTTLTHASPSGAYAKSANRMWECDTDVTKNGADASTCIDMATQLVTQTPGKNFEVMFGGGMGKFLPNTIEDSHGKAGERSDGVNLLSRWQGLHDGGVLVTNRKQLLSVNVSAVSSIVGLFQSKVMDFHMDADANYQPTLSELTEVAIKKLSQNENGYFVFIEGGLIDYGNHFTKAGYALDEVLEFEKAIQLARDITSIEDTLIVVTADHGHAVSIAGYPGRGTPILGINQHDADLNGVKYSVLNYAAGPNQYLDEKGQRIPLDDILGSDDAITPSYIAKDQGVHSGEDVGVFASGPQSHLFTGVMQQSTIPHLMAYASCVGSGKKVCDN
ncbi:LOW QUALITY PROTEIN: membrane-bound alkaline phosphatase [Drosophila gunungcola]|uniref:LOW QUALITY PROTEIN: membrane-bound alkaline phosphatase n=1 Tax=Drosophila gunungcola TaxID=103775 RepID=UPI0022E8CF99|nr:LOW QUALITY PROTEIN: membrane-bound alkaline phosphatase [Drosophila gunungcola]